MKENPETAGSDIDNTMKQVWDRAKLLKAIEEKWLGL